VSKDITPNPKDTGLLNLVGCARRFIFVFGFTLFYHVEDICRPTEVCLGDRSGGAKTAQRLRDLYVSLRVEAVADGRNSMCRGKFLEVRDNGVHE
jgi:hypothetical protein